MNGIIHLFYLYRYDTSVLIVKYFFIQCHPIYKSDKQPKGENILWQSARGFHYKLLPVGGRGPTSNAQTGVYFLAGPSNMIWYIFNA